MKRKRLSDQKKHGVKYVKRVEKNALKVRQDTKICRIR